MPQGQGQNVSQLQQRLTQQQTMRMPNQLQQAQHRQAMMNQVFIPNDFAKYEKQLQVVLPLR